jgi:hypothetical protein
VTIRTLQGFIFDPSTITSSTISVDSNEEDDDNEKEESDPRAMVKKGSNSHISGFNNNSKMKQLNLDQFIKK